TPLPENATAPAATNSAPVRREWLSWTVKRLDSVAGAGEACARRVLGARERILGGEEQRFYAMRIARETRVAGDAAHRHPRELERERRVDRERELHRRVLVGQSHCEYGELVVAHAPREVAARSLSHAVGRLAQHAVGRLVADDDVHAAKVPEIG